MKNSIMLKIIIVITVMLLPTFASSEENYKFERLWPTLKQPWYFNSPTGIAADATGNIYVVDTGNNRILKFNSDGMFISSWGSKGSNFGEFNFPQGIAVDAEGHIYVADTENHRIQKFTSNGAFLSTWGSKGDGDGEFGGPPEGSGGPEGITVDATGHIYVADTWNHRIQKFTSNGAFLSTWGSKGNGDGEFNFPQGIAVDAEGHIYVADTENHRIQKFTSNGAFLSTWGSKGDGDGEFNFPQGIAVDAEGHIYVADTRNHRIQKFTSNGEFLSTWGSEGNDNGNFNRPEGIIINSQGYIYVVDTGNHRIQKFTSDGAFITTWGSGNGELFLPEGISIDTQGNLYVADTENHRIQKFTSDGLFISNWGSFGSLDGQFNRPKGIAVDTQGYLYVADTENHRIQKFTSDGTFVGWWGKDDMVYNGWHDLGSGRYGVSGNGDGEFNFPQGIAVDAEGHIYVADTENHRIQKFTSNGAFLSTWGSKGNGDGEFNFPQGIAVDAEGHIYVADTRNHRIQKFTSNGEFLSTWGSQGNGDGEFNFPQGIAVDAEGHIYVVDTYNHRIQKFESDSTLIAELGEVGSFPGQMSYPADLAVGPAGKVCHVDTGNNRVQVFKKYDILANSKAIIVAGGGPYAGNSLWDATQWCVNFAYRVLIYQGFTKDDIYYLTSDTELDLDGNGIPDEVAGEVTNANLQYAITKWFENESVDSLVLYLTGHGGSDTFRMNETENLLSNDLAGWLNELETKLLDIGISIRIFVIYDAAQSGSFIDDLSGGNRTIITSTLPEESAKFLNQGTISFSGYFWTDIMNGMSIRKAFLNASQIINFAFSNQNPQLSGKAENVYIGNGVQNIVGEPPVIGSVSPPQEIIEETSATIYASDVIDPEDDGIARVWAVICPPGLDLEEVTDPLIFLPNLELLPTGGNRYEGTYHDFTADGIYKISIYAMDSKGNTSIPRLTTVSRNYPLVKKAIILAGGESADITRRAIENNASIAYNALQSQLYTDDDIYFMSVTYFRSEVDIAPSNTTLLSYLNNLVGDPNIENLDLVIYLIGEGDTETFKLNDDDPSEMLVASDLDMWIDNLQNSVKSRVTIVFDADKSGSFIPVLTPPLEKERILIASACENCAAYFVGDGDVCFSSFFWGHISSGSNLYQAFSYSKSNFFLLERGDEISFSCYKQQTPILEANGNGRANEESDYFIARSISIGIGTKKFAYDPPIIGSVYAEETEDGVIIVAEDIPLTSPIKRVWAVIKSIDYCPGYSGKEKREEGKNFMQIELLDPDADGRYEALYTNPFKAYTISVYAVDEIINTGTVTKHFSLSKELLVHQSGEDLYEDYEHFSLPERLRMNHSGGNLLEDYEIGQPTVIVVNHGVLLQQHIAGSAFSFNYKNTPQPHNFHSSADIDWIKFLGIAGENYTILAENLGDDCKPIMELYYEDDIAPIAVRDTIIDNTVSIDFECLRDGVYYVKLFNNTDDNINYGQLLDSTNYTTNNYSKKTRYDLSIIPTMNLLTLITGKVMNQVTWDGIDGALINTDGGGTAISVQGEYDLYQKPGNWDLYARAHGYSSYFGEISVETFDQIIAKDIMMTPIDTSTTTVPPSGCKTNADCDDRLFCNGLEMCVGGKCSSGIHIPCPDDGLFCNGEEICDEDNNICTQSGNPCLGNLTCNEDNDVCEGCLKDSDCYDGLFCTGVETCVEGVCQPGTDRCLDDGQFCNGVEICDEENNSCLNSGNPCSEPTAVCDEENDVCTAGEAPVPTILLQPDFCYQSRWFPLPMFLRIEGSDTHFGASSTVTFNPSGTLMGLPLVMDEETLMIIGLIMPSWLTGPLDSLDVTVTTGSEEVYESLNIEPMTLMFEEGREILEGSKP